MVSFAPGSYVKANVSVYNQNYQGPVSFSTSVFPAGSASIISDSGLAFQISPSTLQLTRNSTVSAALVVSSDSAMLPGQFSVDIFVHAGNYSNYGLFTVDVVGFALRASKAPPAILSGMSTSSTVDVVGFCDVTIMASASNPGLSVSGGSVYLRLSQPSLFSTHNLVNLTINADPNTPIGVYTVTVTGTGCGQVKLAMIQVTIVGVFQVAYFSAAAAIGITGLLLIRARRARARRTGSPEGDKVPNSPDNFGREVRYRFFLQSGRP